MSVNVVDGMLTFQGEKASGCSGLNTLIVEVPDKKLLIGHFCPNGGTNKTLGWFWPKIWLFCLKVQAAVPHPVMQVANKVRWGSCNLGGWKMTMQDPLAEFRVCGKPRKTS